MAARIAVLGLGNFGTALARVWSLHGNRVRGWTVEADVHARLRDTHVNDKYLPGVELPDAEVTMDLHRALDGAEVVALALPSHVILDVIDDAAPMLTDGQMLLDLAKGLAPGDRLVSEAIRDKLHAGGRTNPLAVMSGPTIAPEVARGVTTTALVASAEVEVARALAATLSTDTLKLRPANDMLGVELWGAFKNVIALARTFHECRGLSPMWPAGGYNVPCVTY